MPGNYSEPSCELADAGFFLVRVIPSRSAVFRVTSNTLRVVLVGRTAYQNDTHLRRETPFLADGASFGWTDVPLAIICSRELFSIQATDTSFR